MKISYSILKTAVICFVFYKALFYSFLFLVSGMWMITVLLLILFVYLCKSFLGEVTVLANQFKSFPQFSLKEKLSKLNFKLKTNRQFSAKLSEIQ